MNKETIEDLYIYKEYINLMYYSYNIMDKFPKFEKLGICSDIKHTLYDGLRCIINAYKTFNNNEKSAFLNQLDLNLKVLKVEVRICFRKKHINKRNYEAWSRYITNINNNMFGWIKLCQKK